MMTRRESVTIGEARVGGPGTVLYTLGLGSCVAIVLWDPVSRIGGLAHAMLPAPSNGNAGANVTRFASTAVDALLAMMLDAGAQRATIRARLAGGASMFNALLNERGRRLGSRNIEAARAALARAGVPMDREDAGGTHGRSVCLNVDDGRVIVSSVLYPDVVL